MKNKFILIIVIVMMGLCVANSKILIYANNHTDISSSSNGMVVIEGSTNTVLYEKNKDVRLPMASTTKIITAILAIEKTNDIDEKFIVSDNAVGIEGTSIYIKSGEKFSMKELLYGLILASGNDCAVAIAERLGGIEKFVEDMNNLSISLGLQNTHFDNPHGLDSNTHYTSAYDLAILTSYALKNETFREIISTKRMVLEPTDMYQARYLKNKDKLLFLDENCIGGKTGFTDNAGRCLVNVHEENNMTIISVVLNCQPMFEECQRLTEKVLENYKMKEFIQPYNFVCDIAISNSSKPEIGIITIQGFKLPILKNEEHLYDIVYDIPKSLSAPIALNEIVGKVKVVKNNNEIIFEDDLITIENADNNDIKYLLDNIIDKWF